MMLVFKNKQIIIVSKFHTNSIDNGFGLFKHGPAWNIPSSSRLESITEKLKIRLNLFSKYKTADEYFTKMFLIEYRDGYKIFIHTSWCKPKTIAGELVKFETANVLNPMSYKNDYLIAMNKFLRSL